MLISRQPRSRRPLSAALAAAAIACPTLAHAGTYCPPPDAPTCLDPAYQQTACYAQMKASCASAFQDSYSKSWTASPLPQQSKMVPRQAPTPQAGTFVPTKVVPYTPKGEQVTGGTGTYVTMLERIRHYQPPMGIISIYRDPRDDWAANGNRVASCAEYTYEKNYELSQFEDAIVPMRGDYRAIFHKLMDPGSPLRNGTFKNRMGASLGTLYTATGNAPKNPYFATDITQLAHLWGNTRPMLGNNPDVAAFRAGPYMKGAYMPQWTWTMHRDNGLGYLNANSDDTFLMFDQMKSDWQTAIAQRDAYFKRAQACSWGEAPNDPICTGSYSYHDATGFPVMKALNDGVYNFDQTILAQFEDARAHACLDADNPQLCDWSPSAMVDWMLNDMHSREEAQYQRCVTFTHNNFSDVKSVFADLQNPQFIAITDGYVRNFDARADTISLDLLFDQLEQWINHFNFPRDPVTDKLLVGGSVSDDTTVGLDMFGAQLGYQAKWLVDHFDGNHPVDGSAVQLCEANVHVMGNVHAIGHAVGQTFDIVQATGSLDTDQSNVTIATDFLVMGQRIYTPVQKDTVNFHFVVGDSSEQTFFQAGTVIPVMGIPLTVQVGVSGGVGYQGVFSGSAVHSCSATGGGLGVSVNGSFTPDAFVKSWASAGIDAGLFSVGVKGELTLVDIKLPLTTTVTLAGTNDNDIQLTADAKLDLEIGTLDGRIFAFIDYFLGSTELTLASWNGPSATLNLFHQNFASIPFKYARVIDQL